MTHLHRSPHRKDVTAEMVRHLFDYDPATGIFRWKNPTRNGVNKGDVAGSIWRGRRVLSIWSYQFKASHIAWLYLHGQWPKLEIDHRNRNSLDDSAGNLRDVPSPINAFNRGKQKNNTSGFKGVYWRRARKRWSARIGINNIRYGLGSYPTAEYAAAAYRIAAAVIEN